MKKIGVLLILIMLLTSLGACTSTRDGDVSNDDGGSNNEPDNEVSVDDLEYADTIQINFTSENNQRTITYQQATPLTMPDGEVIMQGQLKPVWQYISKEIGVNFEDVTVQDQATSEMMDVQAATGFKNSTVYGGNSSAEALMSYGAQGYFVDLNDYLQYMPNFSAYLEENPAVRTAITAYDGGIYHTPYAAELNQYARVFLARESWVTTLLDSEDNLLDETAQLSVAYEGYWDRNATNVVELQNQAAASGQLDSATALQVLKDYIAATYPDLEKPSDLYLGSNAQYDIDELVALLRVVKLSPNTLTNLTTGSVVDNALISPFFVRQSSYRFDILRFANYFGGQRVYGSDSYNAKFYLDEEGVLQFSHAQDGFIDSLSYIKAMYDEGLIHAEFADESNKENFRTMLYGRDTVEGQKQFGFMTNDWIASTAASNPDAIGMLPPLTTIDSDEFIHYIENTRVIKPDGWGISTAASQEEINSAVKLLDYFYTEEGNILQNYGPPSTLEQDETFEFGGVEYPKLNDWMVKNAQEFKNGDSSAFLRDFLGGLLPVGYQKNIGFELQSTTENGFASWDVYNDANVKMPSYNLEVPIHQLVPPVFSLNDQDLAKISNTAISDDQVEAIFLYITGSSNITSAEQIKELYESAGIEEYVEVYRTAYERMSN